MVDPKVRSIFTRWLTRSQEAGQFERGCKKVPRPPARRRWSIKRRSVTDPRVMPLLLSRQGEVPARKIEAMVRLPFCLANSQAVSTWDRSLAGRRRERYAVDQEENLHGYGIFHV